MDADRPWLSVEREKPPRRHNGSAARAVRAFALAIQHGDEVHRGWLLEAAECWIAGKPLPEARDSKTKAVAS